MLMLMQLQSNLLKCKSSLSSINDCLAVVSNRPGLLAADLIPMRLAVGQAAVAVPPHYLSHCFLAGETRRWHARVLLSRLPIKNFLGAEYVEGIKKLLVHRLRRGCCWGEATDVGDDFIITAEDYARRARPGQCYADCGAE